MPNHRSAAKRQRQNEIRKTRNHAWKSRMRKAIKRAREAVENGSEDRTTLVKEAVSMVNRAKSKNVIPAGTARRFVSRLTHRLSQTS